jgi:hypothetical protein
VRRIAIAMVVACGGRTTHAVSPSNRSTPDDWQGRSNELCAMLGTDPALGVTVLAPLGVTLGARGEWWGSSGGYSGKSWHVTAPAGWRAVGLVSHRPRIAIPNGWRMSDTVFIAGAWIAVDAPVNELCRSLALAPTATGCKRIEPARVVAVTTVEGATRLECAARTEPHG